MSEILHLILKSKWFDMIESGKKTEEYRDFTPYWSNRLINKYGKDYWEGIFKHNSIEQLSVIWKDGMPGIFGLNGIRNYDIVRFHRGYTNRTIDFKYNGLTIGKGKSELGAPKEKVFIIKLGERL